MPDVRLPLAGDVSQVINPWNWMLNAMGNQYGLVNINLGKSADPELERRILEDVGSYGRQLGRMGDVVDVLIRHLPREKLDEHERQAISAFEFQRDEIARLRAQRAKGR